MAHSTDKDVPLNLLKIVRKAKGVTMTQAQDPSKVTKETASFSEFKEILKTWMMQHSGFSGNKELTSFLQGAKRGRNGSESTVWAVRTRRITAPSA